jgi:hypothetical protein
MAHPMRSLSLTDLRFFLKFDCLFEVKGELSHSRILGFGHPDLIFLSKTSKNWFVDCTFRVVPKGFSQCFILMVYSKAHKSYYPVFWVLMTGKHQETYYKVLQECINVSGWTDVDPSVHYNLRF